MHGIWAWPLDGNFTRICAWECMHVMYVAAATISSVKRWKDHSDPWLTLCRIPSHGRPFESTMRMPTRKFPGGQHFGGSSELHVHVGDQDNSEFLVILNALCNMLHHFSSGWKVPRQSLQIVYAMKLQFLK